MELYVVRHGESQANAAGRHAGWSPVPLSQLGRQQAERAGIYLSKIRFDRIIVSDILRARQTAELALPGCEYSLEPRIREINSGDLVGHTIAECVAMYGEEYRTHRQLLNYASYNGETDDILSERVSDFMRDLERQADNGADSETIAVFSHQCAIRQMLCHVLGVRYPHLRILIGNCSIIKLEYVDGKWKLSFVMQADMIE